MAKQEKILKKQATEHNHRSLRLSNTNHTIFLKQDIFIWKLHERFSMKT